MCVWGGGGGGGGLLCDWRAQILNAGESKRLRVLKAYQVYWRGESGDMYLTSINSQLTQDIRI